MTILTAIDISDNKFTERGLAAFLQFLSKCHHLREIVISNNWLMNESIRLFTSVVSRLRLRTLRMCNNQLREKHVSCLSFLSTSLIQSLYLDNNSIGNVGLQHLLTLLMRNTSLKRLYIRNNDIGDTGVLFLVSFLHRNTSLELVDLRNNTLIKAESISALQPFGSRVLFSVSSYPLLDPDRTGLGPVSKLYKDCCIFLQMLRLLSHADVPLHMPRDLLFHPGLPNHQRIVSRLLAQPSLLVQRINSVAKALGDEAAAEIRQLLVDNLELLVVYLGGSPSLRASVETPAGGFVVELGATLSTTTGVVARAGAVKVALVRLLTTLMETNVLRVTHACVVCRVNATIVRLLAMHPWNSVVHGVVLDHVLRILRMENEVLTFDLLRNAGLMRMVVEELGIPGKKPHGYTGHLGIIAEAIQSIHAMCCEETLFSVGNNEDGIEVSKDEWESFYASIHACSM